VSLGKYTFTLEDNTGYGIVMTVPEGESIDEMLYHFKQFLFACGHKVAQSDES